MRKKRDSKSSQNTVCFFLQKEKYKYSFLFVYKDVIYDETMFTQICNSFQEKCIEGVTGVRPVDTIQLNHSYMIFNTTPIGLKDLVFLCLVASTLWLIVRDLC